MKYNCRLCGKEFDKGYGTNIFCSHSCCSKYANSLVKKTKEERDKQLAEARKHINYKNKQPSRGWSCTICGEVFTTRSLMYSHRKTHTKEERSQSFTCPFCNKTWVVSKSGFGYHQRVCKENPNRIMHYWEGKHHSEETKKKISDGEKKAHDEGRGHTWKNRYLNPSYAEQWLYGLLDNNHIEYEKEKPFFGFFLDVAIGNKCIEIDGEQHGEDTRFPEQLERDKRKDALLKEHGWKELRIKWSDARKMPDYFANKILDFIRTGEIIFDGEYATRKQIEEEKLKKQQQLRANGQVSKDGKYVTTMISNEEWLKRKEQILNCGVDLNKFGCINKIAEKTGLTRTIIAKTLRRFNIEWKTHNYKK